MRRYGEGDWLSILSRPEISITGAATATVGRMHVCSGTSTDYTLALPSAVGRTGEFVGVRASNAMTKLLTLDGAGSETIDSALTRILHDGESAILLSDGTEWTKVAGRSIPMVATFVRTTDQTAISANTWTQIILNAASGCAHLWDSANGRAKIVRPGSVQAAFALYLNGVADFMYATATRNGVSNAGPAQAFQQSLPVSSGAAAGAGVAQYSVAAGDYITLACYHGSSGSATAITAGVISLSITETPQW